jgi:hypothetical protein
MTWRRRISMMFAALLICCLSASVIALRKLDHIRSQSAVQELLFVPSPKVMKAMSLGYTGLMADIYWTRAVQYFGRNHHERRLEYHYLGPLLEITSDLDPHLIPTYEFGSVFLAQKPPEGAGEPDRAIQLVEKGIKHNPEYWKLYYSLGFIHWMERKDPAAAADAFQRGVKIPGSHPWMKSMAAAMASESGDRNTARLLWRAMYESTEDQYVKRNATKRLAALDVDDSVDTLELVVLKYKERFGVAPTSWAQLVEAGWLKSTPLDPAGNSYELADDGSVLVQDIDALPFITRGLVKHGGASVSAQSESNVKNPS